MKLIMTIMTLFLSINAFGKVEIRNDYNYSNTYKVLECFDDCTFTSVKDYYKDTNLQVSEGYLVKTDSLDEVGKNLKGEQAESIYQYFIATEFIIGMTGVEFMDGAFYLAPVIVLALPIAVVADIVKAPVYFVGKNTLDIARKSKVKKWGRKIKKALLDNSNYTLNIKSFESRSLLTISLVKLKVK